MKICFFNSGFLPSKGGVATYSYEWAINSSNSDKVDKVQIVSFGNPRPRYERLNKKTKLVAFNSRNFFFIAFTTFIYFIKFFRFNYFHATNLFPVGFFVVFFSKIFGKKSVLTFHGTDAAASGIRPTNAKLRNWAIEHATKVIAVSNFTKDEITRRLNIKRPDITVIHSAVPLNSMLRNYSLEKARTESEIIKKDLSLSANDFVVLSVSTLAPRKGLDYLIKAIASLSDPNVKLILVGRGPEQKKLEELIEQLNVKDRIILTGSVDKVLPYYLLSNLVTLVSYYDREAGDFEGLGLVLLEAQYMGIPVIGTASGGIPEAIDDQVSGFVVPEKDPAIIAQKISHLKNNPELYKLMRLKAREFVSSKFNAEKNINQYINLLNK
jgi:phosphatidyl-myo-inositol dimannoside synthase